MSEVGHLWERLEDYAGKDFYPYHMPGHKRRSWGRLPEEIYGIDITEIDGFDNLHQPEGILRDLQREAARLYGAEESFYLVNGSSCGILSAVSCAVPFGGHILMARNCHRSAYHAAYLRKLTMHYVYPPFLDEYDVFDGVEPGQVQEALEQDGEIDAVLIVSPTYEGRIADVAGIARAVHQRGIPLIVDEAHGAHLGLAEGFASNSCQLGADLVIHSVHKTLPALTQTALLHVNGDRIDRKRLRRFLRIYQSSSPSYLLMAGIDNALQYAKEDNDAFKRFKERYESMVRNLADSCRCLRFLSVEEGKQDVGKLLISVKRCSLTGRQLYDILLQKYHLQLEMASVSFVLAMFTVNDGEEAYRRMTQALTEIDGSLRGEKAEKDFRGFETAGYAERHNEPGAENIEKRYKRLSADNFAERRKDSDPERFGYRRKVPDVESFEERGAGDYRENQEERTCKGRGENQEKTSHRANGKRIKRRLCEEGCDSSRDHRKKRERWEGSRTDAIPLAEAWDRETEMISLEESIGRPIGEFINLYPPGVPLLVPGEPMTERLCREIRNALEQGLQVQGVHREKCRGEAREEIFVPVIL